MTREEEEEPLRGQESFRVGATMAEDPKSRGCLGMLRLAVEKARDRVQAAQEGTMALLPRHVQVVVSNSCSQGSCYVSAMIILLFISLTLLVVTISEHQSSRSCVTLDEGSTVPMDQASTFDHSWQGAAKYFEQLEGIAGSAASRQYKPNARGLHTYVQFSSYRSGPSAFASVGFASNTLWDKFAVSKCWWEDAHKALIEGEVKILATGTREDSEYDTVVIRCILPSHTTHFGGQATMTINDDNFVFYRESHDRSTSPPTHYLSMCASTWGLDSPSEPRLMYEWLAYHLHMGANHFRVYDAGRFDQQLVDVTTPFLANGTLDLIPFREVQQYKLKNMGYMLAFHDCLYSSALSSLWLTFADLSEYLYVRPPTTMYEILRKHADRTLITFGTQEWSNTKCRMGLQLPSVNEWMSKRSDSPFVIEWLTFRKPEAYCSRNDVDKQMCLGSDGARRYILKPKDVYTVHYSYVQEHAGDEVHLPFDEMHKNSYNSLHVSHVYVHVCSEYVPHDEFVNGWVRDLAQAELSKALRKSPLPQVSEDEMNPKKEPPP